MMAYIEGEMKNKIKKRRMSRRFRQQMCHTQESIKQFKETTPST
jgi:DNA-directed RNA polymerase specialized sigma subunit